MVLSVALCCAGASRGAAAVQPAGPDRVDAYTGSGSLAIDAVVREVSGNTVIVDATHVVGADVDRTVHGGVLVPAAALPPLLAGDIVEVDASSLRAPNQRPGPDSFATLEREDVHVAAVAPQVTLLRQGGPSLPRAIAWVQAQLVHSVDASVPEPAAALLLGVAFGIRQPLAPDVRTALQDAGLIHIVVVSGLKVVMVLGMLAAVARALSWSPRMTLLVALSGAALYVLLSGAGPAAIRSALMAAPAMFARLHGRRVDPLPMLALAAALMLGIDPPLVADAGFQLSFLGTAGILLLAAPLASRIPGPRLLAEPFAVTVAAQVATVPVMAGTFGVIALGGPVANALVLPMLPALIVAGGGAAIVGAVLPWVAWAPLHLAAAVSDAIVVLARAVSAVPVAVIHVGYWPVAWSVGAATAAVVGTTILCTTRHEEFALNAAHPAVPMP